MAVWGPRLRDDSLPPHHRRLAARLVPCPCARPGASSSVRRQRGQTIPPRIETARLLEDSGDGSLRCILGTGRVQQEAPTEFVEQQPEETEEVWTRVPVAVPEPGEQALDRGSDFSLHLIAAAPMAGLGAARRDSDFMTRAGEYASSRALGSTEPQILRDRGLRWGRPQKKARQLHHPMVEVTPLLCAPRKIGGRGRPNSAGRSCEAQTRRQR